MQGKVVPGDEMLTPAGALPVSNWITPDALSLVANQHHKFYRLDPQNGWMDSSGDLETSHFCHWLPPLRP